MPTNRPAPADNHDVERAEAALSSATITRISGPRPVRDRRWFGKTLFYTATLATGALVSMAGNAMLEKSGLKDELHAYRNPVAAVESAPQLIQWVQLPSSPFLEAGRQPDGTISIHHMLQAWNDAGLSHALVPSVIQRVNLLRPTLLGRADPVLELQLQTEAAKAARELADSTVIVLAGASTYGAVAAARYFVEQCKFRRGWFAAVVSSQMRDDHVCPPEIVRIERLARPGAKP